ncbi:hypothetical protein D3C78_1315090 [compost metagenome]
MCPSNTLAKYLVGVPCTGPKCWASTRLSTSSRGLVSMIRVSRCQSCDHSSLSISGRCGITTSAAGALPSGLFQTNSRPFSSQVSQERVLALGGMRSQ